MDISAHNRLPEHITMGMMDLLLPVASAILLAVLGLLSRSAVVYTVVCIYMGKAVTFSTALSVFPRVWRRLLVTSAWGSLLFITYNIIAFIVLYLMIRTLNSVPVLLSSLMILLVLYLTGLVYMTIIIWLLVDVISVLEEDYGICAMVKSKMLMRGKMGAGAVIILLLNLSYMAIQSVFQISMVDRLSF